MLKSLTQRALRKAFFVLFLKFSTFFPNSMLQLVRSNQFVTMEAQYAKKKEFRKEGLALL